jgi:outer membrane immunogenic protein
MRKFIALAVIGAGFAATPALAQSNEAPGGFYVGALGGYEGVDV